ncbi:unnamed protein product, partial [Rotaria magnacalcarata]
MIESDCCQRCCCPNTREFTVNILDKSNPQEVIRIHREFKCCSCCGCWCGSCPHCMQEVTVESPPGTIIGTVTQVGTSFGMNYLIKDAYDTSTLYIIGPSCLCHGPATYCCENKFTLLGSDHETEIGAIHKKYSGFFRECCSNPDIFSMK